MEEFLRKRELISFSVVSEFFPEKEKFLSKVKELDGQTVKIWTVLPDGTKVFLESVSSETFRCPCENGILHGDFEEIDSTFSQKRTGTFKHGKPHGVFTVWKENFFKCSATFVDGEPLELDEVCPVDEFLGKDSNKNLFSRNKKKKTLHVTSWRQQEDNVLTIKKRWMTEVEDCANVRFDSYVVPFAKEQRHTFKRQVVRTKKFLDDGSLVEKKRTKQYFHYLIGSAVSFF
nr:hypothetical protein [Marseillevirus cajuinensis]